MDLTLACNDYKNMTMVNKVIPAGEFKPKCLALLDEVAQTGETRVVTKRGKPVAQLSPVEGQEPPSLRGSILYEGDLISPVDEAWNEDR